MPTDHELRRAFGDARATPQRLTIARAAGAMSGAFSVEELISDARAADAGIGVATVYRAVSAMEDSGWLERVGERHGSALYARCDAGAHHHHHLVCTGCGRVEPARCPLPALTSAAEEAGFVVTAHDVTVYGLCASCRTGARA